MSSDNPIVSVVMPIFKHTKAQLMTAIESILNQTYADFEFIIVDGNPTDENFEIISAIKDERIKYYRAKGYINCLNFGLKQAKGKYIARMDSDDISYPTRLETQVQFLEDNPQISLCSCLVEYFGNTKKLKISQHTQEVNLINFIKKHEFVHTAMMFRKDLDVQYDFVKPLEDCLLFRKLLLEGYKFAIIDQVLLKSFRSDKSYMLRYPKLMCQKKGKINIYALAKYYDFKLSFLDEIFTKRRFSNSEILEYLRFIKFLKHEAKHNGLNVSRICTPFFLYMLSRSEDKYFVFRTPLFYQEFFMTYARFVLKQCLKFVFSIYNEYSCHEKRKIVRILGMKFKFAV